MHQDTRSRRDQSVRMDRPGSPLNTRPRRWPSGTEEVVVRILDQAAEQHRTAIYLAVLREAHALQTLVVEHQELADGWYVRRHQGSQSSTRHDDHSARHRRPTTQRNRAKRSYRGTWRRWKGSRLVIDERTTSDGRVCRPRSRVAGQAAELVSGRTQQLGA